MKIVSMLGIAFSMLGIASRVGNQRVESGQSARPAWNLMANFGQTRAQANLVIADKHLVISNKHG
jgi:hypothetical protein